MAMQNSIIAILVYQLNYLEKNSLNGNWYSNSDNFVMKIRSNLVVKKTCFGLIQIIMQCNKLNKGIGLKNGPILFLQY